MLPFRDTHWVVCPAASPVRAAPISTAAAVRDGDDDVRIVNGLKSPISAVNAKFAVVVTISFGLLPLYSLSMRARCDDSAMRSVYSRQVVGGRERGVVLEGTRLEDKGKQ